MNPKIQSLLDSVRQLADEVEAESGGMEDMKDDSSEGMEKDMSGEESEMSGGAGGTGGTELEIEMKPMRKRQMDEGRMPSALSRYSGGK